jgi:DNA-binding NtrC family response regulator
MSHVVLLADDDAAIRMVLNQALTRAGYEVRPTGNISTMWNWVSRGEGDVLITDVAMPDGNAFEVMPKIKKLRPDLPMIVMSAQNTFMGVGSRSLRVSAEAIRHHRSALRGFACLGRRQEAGECRAQG